MLLLVQYQKQASGLWKPMNYTNTHMQTATALSYKPAVVLARQHQLMHVQCVTNACDWLRVTYTSLGRSQVKLFWLAKLYCIAALKCLSDNIIITGIEGCWGPQHFVLINPFCLFFHDRVFPLSTMVPSKVTMVAMTPITGRLSGQTTTQAATSTSLSAL